MSRNLSMAYKESFKDRLDDLMMKNFDKQIRLLLKEKSVKLKTCVAKFRFWRFRTNYIYIQKLFSTFRKSKYIYILQKIHK